MVPIPGRVNDIAHDIAHSIRLRAETLRLGLAIRLAGVPGGGSQTHDFIIAFAHRLLIVKPAALGQAVGEVMNQHARLVNFQLLGNSGVGPGNERSPMGIRLRGVVADRPQSIVGATGRNLAHVERIQAVRAFRPGIVEGMDHDRSAEFPIRDVKLRPANVVADGQANPHTPDVVRHEAVADRVVFLVAPGAEALVSHTRPSAGTRQLAALGAARYAERGAAWHQSTLPALPCSQGCQPASTPAAQGPARVCH